MGMILGVLIRMGSIDTENNLVNQNLRGDTITSIGYIYHNYIKHLKSKEKQISVLQLTGRIEDFLVKEFIYCAYAESNKKIFGLTNVGKSKEQKIDICLQRKVKGQIEIMGMIEAKYIRNVHRYNTILNAKDEINDSLKSFGKQVHKYSKSIHGGYNVNLISKDNNIYGLIFTSYADRKEDNEWNKFRKNIISKANELGFMYQDKSKAYLDIIYENVSTTIFDEEYFVSLASGLWIKKE